MRHQLKRGLLWTLYAGLMVVAFLLLTFPYDQLQARILAEVSRNTGWTIAAGQWSLSWPAGLEWRDVSVVAPGAPQVRLDRVRVSLVPASVLQKHPSVTARIESGEGPEETRGYVIGHGTLRAWSKKPVLVRVTGTAERFDVGRLGLPGMKRGLLKGEFDQRWNEAGEGKWQLEFTDMQLESIPVGPAVLPLVRFSNLKARAQCRDSLCQIESFSGTGPDGTLSATGTLGPRNPAVASELAVAVTLTVSQEFAQRAAANGMAMALPGTPLSINLKGPVSNLQLGL